MSVAKSNHAIRILPCKLVFTVVLVLSLCMDPGGISPPFSLERRQRKGKISVNALIASLYCVKSWIFGLILTR